MATIHQTVPGDSVNGIQTPTVTALTAGRAVVVAVIRNSGNVTTWTVSDGSNTYSTDLSELGVTGADEDLFVFSARNITGGPTTITIDPVDETTGWSYCIWEVSGLDNSATPSVDTNPGEAATTSHVCGATGLTGSGLFVGLGQFGELENVTAGSGYSTDNNVTAAPCCIQRKLGSGTLDKAPYTTGTTTNTYGAMVLYIDVSVPPNRKLRRGWRVKRLP